MFITKEMASYIRCIFRNSTKSRNFFTHSENGLREYNHQLSKFNANEDNHESRISAAREIAIAVQSDPQICLNMPLLAERNKKQILYNVTGGRDWRFKICYHSYQQLAPKTMLTNEHMLQVALMGYLLEQVLSAYAVLDDIGDQAELRRNKKPWYKEDGKQVANDATILLHGAFVVLKLFFKDQPYYKRCSEILNEAAIWMLAQAQSLDMTLNDIFGSQKQYFTVETHRKISSGKTRATCFYAPTIMAMQMADYDYSAFHDQLMNIFTDLGIYLLVENDYCDRYGKTTGKALDEDIKNGKLTWMSLTAMQHANSEQKKIIMECYGKEDPRSTQAVVDIYEQLNLKEKVNAYKKELTENIQKNISQLPDPRVQNALTYSLKCIEMWYYA